MKKALKIISSVCVFAVIISVFCACEINFGGKEETTASSVPSTESTTASETNPIYTRPVEEPSSSSTSQKVEIDSLDTILNNIKDYPANTSGSVTKAYQIAYKLLNFTQNSNFTANEAQQDYANFVATLDEDEKYIYAENLVEIDYCVRNIVKDPSILDSHLENYTPISESGEITLANYEALYAIISK